MEYDNYIHLGWGQDVWTHYRGIFLDQLVSIQQLGGVIGSATRVGHDYYADVDKSIKIDFAYHILGSASLCTVAEVAWRPALKLRPIMNNRCLCDCSCFLNCTILPIT